MFVISAMAEITNELPPNINSWSWTVKTNSLTLNFIGLSNLANTNNGFNVKIVNVERCPVCKHKGRLLSTALLSDSIFWVKFYAFLSLEIQPVKGCKAETGGLRLTQFLSSAWGLPVLCPVSELGPQCSSPRLPRVLAGQFSRLRRRLVPAVDFCKGWKGTPHSLALRACLH